MKITKREKGRIKTAIHNTVKSGLFNLDLINGRQLKKQKVENLIKGVKFTLEVTAVLENKEIMKIKDKRIS